MSGFVKLVVFVPETHADAVRAALGEAGAGKIENYSFCSASQKSAGRFKPEEGARPAIGKIETVAEERIETVCQEEDLEKVIAAVRKAHPYEEPAIEAWPLIYP